MTTMPTSAYVTNAARTVAEKKAAWTDLLAALAEFPGGAAESALTIASGQITPTGALHTVDTESAAATDDLTHIVTANHPEGRILILHGANDSRVVTVKHESGGAGQVSLSGGADVSLSTVSWIMLARIGTGWKQIMIQSSIGTLANNKIWIGNASGVPTATSQLSYLQMPVGSVWMVLHTETPPPGTLFLNGQAVSRTTYAALFALYGTKYGAGDGSTTFNLPKFAFLRNWDGGSGTDPGAASRTDRGDGTVGNHVGTKQAGQFASHSHRHGSNPDGYTGHPNYVGGVPSHEAQPGGESGSTGTVDAYTGSAGVAGGTWPDNVAALYVVKY